MFIRLTDESLIKLDSIFKVVSNSQGRILHLTDGTTLHLTSEDMYLIEATFKKKNLLAYLEYAEEDVNS